MKLLIAMVVAMLCSCAQAQMHHDPLNDREVELLRDSAQDPKKRIDLMISFVRERMMAIDRLRSPNKSGVEDPGKVAEMLADVAALVDELDDNLTMYNGHSEDLRRPLHHVLDAEAEFLQKLKSLSEIATPVQKRHFAAALEDATDSVKSSTESANAMLADQIVKKGEDKTSAKQDRKDAKQAQDAASGKHQPPPDYTGMGGVGQTPPER